MIWVRSHDIQLTDQLSRERELIVTAVQLL